MLPTTRSALVLFALTTCLCAQTVRFQTNLGTIDVILDPANTPLTVANFLSYTYLNTIFHRSTSLDKDGLAVIQGGGFNLVLNGPVTNPSNPTVKGEFKNSNIRGTLAMALSGSSSGGTDVNSGTNQWFFNISDNSAALDPQKFTVFGKVATDAGLAIMDAISATKTYDGGGVFSQIPLINYNSRGNVAPANYVIVKTITTLAPAVTAAGFTDSATYLANTIAGVAPGELLTIFGTDLGPSQVVGLIIGDNNTVTNSLVGTSVLFDGTPGAMIYTSTGQISVVAPYNLAGKTSVKVVLQYLGTQTASVQLPVVAVNPGLFTLSGSGKGDAAIVRNFDGSVVNAAKPASPGDDLLLYGHGYGMATPSTALGDGVIVGNALPVPAVKPILLIDGKAADTQYIGAAPSAVNGVLQVNFRVPPGLAAGTHSIQIQSGSVTSPAGVTLQTK